jgi:hypothetical protein
MQYYPWPEIGISVVCMHWHTTATLSSAGGLPATRHLEHLLLHNIPKCRPRSKCREQLSCTAFFLCFLLPSDLMAPSSSVLQQVLLNLLTSVFAGHLGDLALASASLGTSVYNATGFWVLSGLAGAVDTLAGSVRSSFFLCFIIVIIVGTYTMRSQHSDPLYGRWSKVRSVLLRRPFPLGLRDRRLLPADKIRDRGTVV